MNIILDISITLTFFKLNIMATGCVLIIWYTQQKATAQFGPLERTSLD
jgi:hypothetical protein